jgi:outer membrane protein assembly factor BamB
MSNGLTFPPTPPQLRIDPEGGLAWRRAAWVAAAFTLLLGLAMVIGHFQVRADDPLHSSRLNELKEKLRLNPADEALKQGIRNLDLQLRQRYFRQLSRMNSGTWLALGGIAVFVFAAARAAQFQRKPPMPQPKPASADPSTSARARARWAIAACGSAFGAFLFVLSLSRGAPLPKNPDQADKALGAVVEAAAASDIPSLEEFRLNWPRFRGPDGGGISPFTNAPLTWDVKTGAGIAWKAAVPATGFNSPIAWGDRVFFSGGDASKREVFCLDSKTGQLLWRQVVAAIPVGPAKPAEVPDTTGYAASTMASDGRRVYVIFATGDVAAFTFDGKQVWAKSLGPLKNPYGHAASLATWRDRLIVQLDQGEAEEAKSKLIALDGRTGQSVWEQRRKVGASWASPIVFEAAGKPQVVTLAVPWVIAYAATDGAELWRVECLNGEITPSPIFAGGLVIVPSPSEKLLAIRPDGHGDVTKTHIVWTNEDNVPDVTSPVGSGDLVFTVTTGGMLSCFDAKDGKKLWEHDFEMECHASPAIAGRRLYVFSQKGAAVVVEAAREFKELFRTEMGDVIHASPAFMPERIFLRGVTNVWCLGPVKPN